MKNFVYTLMCAAGSFVSFYLAYATATYQIDKYIKFAGEDNAMGFCILCLVFGFGFAGAAITNRHTTEA